jgi:hypothetical protein
MLSYKWSLPSHLGHAASEPHLNKSSKVCKGSGKVNHKPLACIELVFTGRQLS